MSKDRLEPKKEVLTVQFEDALKKRGGMSNDDKRMGRLCKKENSIYGQ